LKDNSSKHNQGSVTNAGSGLSDKHWNEDEGKAEQKAEADLMAQATSGSADTQGR
jgi:hypothetical protein